MNNQFAKSICSVLITFSFVCTARVVLAQPSELSGAYTDKSPSTIRLTLQTSKLKYHLGEPIEVLAYLVNQSDKSYYVGNTLLGFWGTSELHEMRLRIIDSNNKEVVIGGGGGSWIWKPNTSIAEKVEQAYTQLRPDMILGIKENVPVKLRAGRYHITATYREIEASSWTEAERKSFSISVWTQPLTSNTVIITVSP